MLTGYPVKELIDRVNAQHRAQADLTYGTHGTKFFSHNGHLALKGIFLRRDDGSSYGKDQPILVTKHALGQIADFTGLGRNTVSQYMNTGFINELAGQLNLWFSHKGKTKLFRCMWHEDRTPYLRAFLDDAYKPFDSYDALKILLPELALYQSEGLQFKASYLTEDYMSIKVFLPGKTAEIKAGDVIYSGVEIVTGSTGLYSTAVTPMSYRCWCDNGAKHMDSAFKATHIRQGSFNFLEGYDELISGSRECREQQDLLVATQLKTVVNHFLRGSWIETVANQFKAAQGIKVSRNKATALTQEFLPKEHQDLVLDQFFTHEDKNMFGFVNAITAVAHGSDIAERSDAYTLSTELEALGGRVLDKYAPPAMAYA